MAYDVQLVHLDQMLSPISIGYTNEAFVGETILPTVPVGKQSDKYYTFGKEHFIYEDDDYRAPGTEAHEIPGLSLSRTAYFCQEHALQIGVNDEEKENADDVQPLLDGTSLVSERLALGREVKIATLMRATGTYATGHNTTLSGTAQWDDYTDSDPIGIVKTARDLIHSKIFRKPNVMLMGHEVASKLEDHPAAISRIQFVKEGITNLDLWARLFDIDRIVVGSCGYNTANPNQNESLSYVWGKDVILGYVPPTARKKTPGLGYAFQWNYDAGGRPTERWREESRGRDVVRVRNRYDLAITCDTAGYVIKAAVS